jgi:hypothetical protein
MLKLNSMRAVASDLNVLLNIISPSTKILIEACRRKPCSFAVVDKIPRLKRKPLWASVISHAGHGEESATEGAPPSIVVETQGQGLCRGQGLASQLLTAMLLDRREADRARWLAPLS